VSAFQAVSNHILLLTHARTHRGGTTAAPTPAVLKPRNQTTEPCQLCWRALCNTAPQYRASSAPRDTWLSVCAKRGLGESGRDTGPRLELRVLSSGECTTAQQRQSHAQAQVRADTGFHNELWWCSLRSPHLEHAMPRRTKPSHVCTLVRGSEREICGFAQDRDMI